jgi:regulator of cell morphogenesis and NO signaling
VAFKVDIEVSKSILLIREMSKRMTLNAQTPVGQIVTERLGRAAVLDRLGIDYCCRGKMTLGQACAERGIELGEVLRALSAVEIDAASADQVEYSALPAGALADHIVETHHTYLREVLPRLDVQFDKVVEVHAERHPELRQMQDVFRRQWAELVLHLVREEQVLFPFIKQLEARASLPRIYRGSVDYPIRVMEHEHDSTGSALKSLRKLSGGFAAPPDACPTYRALLHGLAELEADLHRHIHKENNILFPKASALEASLREGKAAPSPSSGESPAGSATTTPRLPSPGSPAAGNERSPPSSSD